MSQPEQHHQRYDDEISLVDLATTFIRRRNVFFVVFGGVVIIALLYAFLVVGEVREYRTLVQLAEENNRAVEAPAAVVAAIQSRWFPEWQSVYAETEGEKLEIKLAAEHPENTNLIKLTSEASPEDAELVITTHQKMVDEILQRQNTVISRSRKTLEQRLDSVNEILEQLDGQEGAGEAIAQTIKERVNLEARLEDLQPAEVLVVARQGTDNKGTSKKLILALALVLGGMFGIFAAFMAEFASHVRKAMAESRT